MSKLPFPESNVENLRFKTSSRRISTWEALINILTQILKTEKHENCLDGLEKLGTPASPVNDITLVRTAPQFQHRGIKIIVPCETLLPGS